MDNPVDLSTQLGSLRLKNPVLTASGTFGYGIEFESLVDLNRLGGIIVKGLSLKPSSGNPPPRIVETPCGMLNSIGLENIGVEAFIAEKLPILETYHTPVFANIYGSSIEEYAALAARIDSVDSITGLEVNISCPNVKSGGVAFGIDAIVAASVIRAVKKETSKFVVAKLSPNVTSIADIASSVEDAGADAVSLINTITGMAIDIRTRRPVLANITGGLSGPAIRPVALRMVWEAARAVKIPVIGIGGIVSAIDAISFLIAGASAVEVGTANFLNPGACMDIIDGMESFFAEEGISSTAEIIGSVVL
ncbi:MAG: dihydroorotate dehydrogenase [Deltaproteobacteria bacterium]|nr:dihydroorotate dehydrogenase [Deltaproteobacteria bacterium]